MKKIVLFILILLSIISCGKSEKSKKEFYELNIKTEPEGRNFFIVSPKMESYPKGTKVKIYPISSNGYKFSGWTGENDSDIINGEIILNEDKEIKAVFEIIDVPLYSEYYNFFENVKQKIKYEYNENLFLKKETWYSSKNKIEKIIEYDYEGFILKKHIEKNEYGDIVLNINYFYDENYNLIEKNIDENGKMEKIKIESEQNKIKKEIYNQEKINMFVYDYKGLLVNQEIYSNNTMQYKWNYIYDDKKIIKKEKIRIKDNEIIENYIYSYEEQENKKYELKVSVTGLGIVNPIYGEYEYGTEIELNPIPNNGYYFKGWEEKDSENMIGNKIIMDSNKNIRAVFLLKEKDSNFKINLHTNSKQNGLILLLPEKDRYSHGEEVKIKAIDTEKYKFKKWIGEDADSIKLNNSIIIDSDKTIGAEFYEIEPAHKSMIYDGYGVLQFIIHYEYNEKGFLEREIYENALKKIEKYYDYLYYNGKILKKDLRDRDKNFISNEIYDYDEDMEIISITEYNSKNEIISKIITNNEESNQNVKKYKKFYYESGKIDRIHEIVKVYDEKGTKLLKEEYYYEKRPIEIMEYFYEEDKIIKEIAINSITGDTISIKGYEYKENVKKEIKTETKTAENKNYKSKFKNIYYRGTSNNWEKDKMELIDNNIWMIKVNFNKKEEFKFDVYGDWITNFGDKDRDGTAELIDPNGNANHNILFRGEKGKYIILFNDFNLKYKIYTEDSFYLNAEISNIF